MFQSTDTSDVLERFSLIFPTRQPLTGQRGHSSFGSTLMEMSTSPSPTVQPS